MQFIFVRLTIVLTLITVSLSALVDQSIIPVMDYFHSIKHIEAKKYSKTQYQAISDALNLKEGSFRIASYNMLFDRYDHLLAKSYRWAARLPRMVEMIEEMQCDLLCFQELYPAQIDDLMKKIGHEYGVIAQIPEKDEEPCELNGIFYRKTRFHCQNSFVHYISETPQTRSSDPYSNEPRTLVESHFIDRVTKKELAVFCTQLAFGSADSREYAARFILNRLDPISQQKAVVLAGDFNSFSPHVDDPFVPFYDGKFLLRILTQKNLKNALDLSLIGTVGPISTYTNRDGAVLPFQGTGTPGIVLDHIFVSNNITVLIAAIQPAQVDGMYASDHMPIIADCINVR